VRKQYYTPVVHSFTNTANRQEILTLGTTHVAVGFVDLGVLQWATLKPGNKGQTGAPLSFVGVEMCAFNVAKTLVIARLLEKDSGAAPHDILQVWYSATWSDRAHRCFRRALTYVLERSRKSGSMHAITSEVNIYLVHWQRHDVTVAKARSEWILGGESSLIGAGNWKRLADRLALCRYLITGDLAGGGPHGSVMFSHPPEAKAERERGESALTTVSFHSLMKRFSETVRASTDGQEVDVVGTATALIKEGVTRLMEHVRQGRLVITSLRHAVMAPSAHALLEELSAYRPWTVS
jgi:hypothetical protein